MSKCWIHDWEMLERVSASQIRANIEVEGTDLPAMEMVGDCEYYIRKACLKCSEVVDTITPHIEVVRRRIERCKDRQKKALDIMRGEKKQL